MTIEKTLQQLESQWNLRIPELGNSPAGVERLEARYDESLDNLARLTKTPLLMKVAC